ncbi:sulfotransferase family protein [Blastopirellula marina]|uniref:Sulfotransferase family protein n=1 Tax=Blastopirellula marina TaxID=124 RepID=A0A2S8G9G5_9BACT|nr:sulfotransferase family protein [Blastopirellula marina]PQO41105.1 sulfotransferase family protein [Blastopirellula marina]PTL45981.1 sulfotransferase family protein [Blastopirellula marina]
MSLPKPITVVSGLPRSGTSLMMQMIDRGGIAAVTDEIRTADRDNPKGYFEFEPVKRTKDDPAWIPSAEGKVVKMVSSLLYDLPVTHHYRVVFMRRDIDEILDSQEKMLLRLDRPVAPREQIRLAFAVHLDRLFDWIPSQKHLELLEISYNDLLADPVEQVGRLNHFLGGNLATQAMIETIDPKLYRNRSMTAETGDR